jgi:23S rRNA (adenine1618-N6)-methyltransferase
LNNSASFKSFTHILQRKKNHPIEKSSLHPRNLHRTRYDFQLLIDACPELAPFVKLNDYQDESIDFFNPSAVKMLNTALLKCYYGVDFWDIPPDYLCPPIPGRADYIHYMADLMSESNLDKIPTGAHIKCLDIGVGANCVYPIIGNKSYGWSFVGGDIDTKALENAQKIIDRNPDLHDRIELRFQKNQTDFFRGIIRKDEYFDLTICNPPFHASLAEARSGTTRKLKNLLQKNFRQPVLNFGGQQSELWCDGGEVRFVRDMMNQSREFAGSCYWFSTLISKESNLKVLLELLKKTTPTIVKTIPMGQGNKKSRIIAWTYLTSDQQQTWRLYRWKT